MELLARELAEVLLSLYGDSVNSEKRLAPRVGIRTRAEIAVPAAQGKGLVRGSVWLRDVSRGGIGMVSPERLSEGARFLLLLPTHGQGIIAVPCEVAHVRTASSGFCQIGARFIGQPYTVNAPRDPLGSDRGGVPLVGADSELQLLRSAIHCAL